MTDKERIERLERLVKILFEMLKEEPRKWILGFFIFKKVVKNDKMLLTTTKQRSILKVQGK